MLHNALHITEDSMNTQTRLAGLEQDFDATHHYSRNKTFNIAEVAALPDPNLASASKHACGVVFTAQNRRTSQEDRADFAICHQTFAAQFLSMTLEQKGRMLYEQITELAKTIPEDSDAGTTLTASYIWTTVDETTNSSTSHIITAQIADSRAVLCDTKRATRLTREHSLHRPHERQEIINLGFRIDQPCGFSVAARRFKIYKDGIHVATQIGEHLYCANEAAGAIQPARSLGDKHLHNNSPVFRSYPDISYQSILTTPKSHLITCSDGITYDISDREMTEILEASSNHVEAARYIAKLAAHRGSDDNISIVITPLHTIKPGDVALQFVADGHGGHEIAALASEHLLKSANLSASNSVTQLIKQYFNYQITAINQILADIRTGISNIDTGIAAITQIINELEYAIQEKILKDICARKWDIRFSLIGGTTTMIDGKKYNLPGHVANMVSTIEEHKHKKLPTLDTFAALFKIGHKGYLKGQKTLTSQADTTTEYYGHFKDLENFYRYCNK